MQELAKFFFLINQNGVTKSNINDFLYVDLKTSFIKAASIVKAIQEKLLLCVDIIISLDHIGIFLGKIYAYITCINMPIKQEYCSLVVGFATYIGKLKFKYLM